LFGTKMEKDRMHPETQELITKKGLKNGVLSQRGKGPEPIVGWG